MKPFVLLRIASILTLLFAAGHTSGGLSLWSPAGETDVLRAMRSFHFDAAGTSRTYLDFYLGFGYILSVYLFAQAVVFWQLASIAKSDAYRTRPLIGTFLLVAIASTVLSWRFIFVVPVICSATISVCLALAFFFSGKRGSGAAK
ncbi:hypothetical protein SAMN05216570_2500 [Dyella sp. OK004]|nr:hypothetical protein SAMN05216570_2500 [Dyella sp. OK004]